MPNFQIPNLDYITTRDPRLGEALRAAQDAINNVAQQSGTVAQGQQNTPTPPSALKVAAAGGIFDIQITDNAPVESGIAPDYFLEYSTSPGFTNPIAIHLGPARNHRATLGNQTLYWRAFSQYGRASQPSAPIYFGGVTSPTAVNGGGAAAGPDPLPSAGSGTAPSSGISGGSGYGRLPVRNPAAPPLP